MQPWELTDEEIHENTSTAEAHRQVSSAALKKLMLWLLGDCAEHAHPEVVAGALNRVECQECLLGVAQRLRIGPEDLT